MSTAFPHPASAELPTRVPPVLIIRRGGAHALHLDLSQVLGLTHAGPAGLTVWVEESSEISLDANYCSPRFLKARWLEAAQNEYPAEIVSGEARSLHDLYELLAGLDPASIHFEGFLRKAAPRSPQLSLDASEYADQVWPSLERLLLPLLSSDALRIAAAAAGSTHLYNALVAHPELQRIFDGAPALGCIAVGSDWARPAAQALAASAAAGADEMVAVADALLLHSPSVPVALKQYPFPSPPAFVEWLRRVPVSHSVLLPPIDNEPRWPDLLHAVHRASEEIEPQELSRLRTPRQWFAFHAASLSYADACPLVLTNPEAAVAVLDERSQAGMGKRRGHQRDYSDWRFEVNTMFGNLEQAAGIGGAKRFHEQQSLADALSAADAVMADLRQQHDDALKAAELASVPFPLPEVRTYEWGDWRFRWVENTRHLAELRFTPPNILVMDLESAAVRGEVTIYELESRRYGRIKYWRAGVLVADGRGRLINLRLVPLFEDHLDFDEAWEVLRAAHVRLRRGALQQP
jgi:hypothetical protein